MEITLVNREKKLFSNIKESQQSGIVIYNTLGISKEIICGYFRHFAATWQTKI